MSYLAVAVLFAVMQAPAPAPNAAQDLPRGYF